MQDNSIPTWHVVFTFQSQNMSLVKWLGQAAQLASQRAIWAIQTSYVFGYSLAPEFGNHPILFKTMGPVAGYNIEDNSSDPMYLLISWAGISGQIWENWAGWVREGAWINSVPPWLLKSEWITTPSEFQSPQSSCLPPTTKKHTNKNRIISLVPFPDRMLES